MPCGLNAHVHGTAVRPEPRENEIRYDKMMVTTPRSIPMLWYTLSIDHHGSKVTFARLVRTQQCTLHIGMSQDEDVSSLRAHAAGAEKTKAQPRAGAPSNNHTYAR